MVDALAVSPGGLQTYLPSSALYHSKYIQIVGKPDYKTIVLYYYCIIVVTIILLLLLAFLPDKYCCVVTNAWTEPLNAVRVANTIANSFAPPSSEDYRNSEGVWWNHPGSLQCQST